MSEGRRRTGFEKDLREFLLKLFLGLAAGVALKMWSDYESWTPPLLLGVIVSFWLASAIRNDGSNADKG